MKSITKILEKFQDLKLMYYTETNVEFESEKYQLRIQPLTKRVVFTSKKKNSQNEYYYYSNKKELLSLISDLALSLQTNDYKYLEYYKVNRNTKNLSVTENLRQLKRNLWKKDFTVQEVGFAGEIDYLIVSCDKPFQ